MLLSELNKSEVRSYTKIEFEVDVNNVQFVEFRFSNCKFFFSSEANCTFIRSEFHFCDLFGEELERFELYTSSLTLLDCKIASTKILGSFSSLSIIGKSSIHNLIDNSMCRNYRITGDITVDNFVIRGKTDYLNINDTFFTADTVSEGLWNKEVIKGAKCKKTIFDKVQVNPFFFATKCDDKESLDLTSAVLIDDWSMLRKNYAGLSLFIVFALTLAFFLPLITHSFILLLSSKVDISLIPSEKIPLWKAIFFGGKVGAGAFGYAILTIILVLYNFGRIWMTITIARLREEERFLADSNFKLVSIHPEKYRNQLQVHRWLKIMLWISLGYSVLKLIDTLLISVPNF